MLRDLHPVGWSGLFPPHIGRPAGIPWPGAAPAPGLPVPGPVYRRPGWFSYPRPRLGRFCFPIASAAGWLPRLPFGPPPGKALPLPALHPVAQDRFYFAPSFSPPNGRCIVPVSIYQKALFHPKEKSPRLKFAPAFSLSPRLHPLDGSHIGGARKKGYKKAAKRRLYP